MFDAFYLPISVFPDPPQRKNGNQDIFNLPLSFLWFESSRNTSTTILRLSITNRIEYLRRCCFIANVYISFVVLQEGKKNVRSFVFGCECVPSKYFNFLSFVRLTLQPSSQASPLFAPNSCDLSFGYLLMALHFLPTHATDPNTHTHPACAYASEWCVRARAHMPECMNEWVNVGNPEVLYHLYFYTNYTYLYMYIHVYFVGLICPLASKHLFNVRRCNLIRLQFVRKSKATDRTSILIWPWSY